MLAVMAFPASSVPGKNCAAFTQRIASWAKPPESLAIFTSLSAPLASTVTRRVTLPSLTPSLRFSGKLQASLLRGAAPGIFFRTLWRDNDEWEMFTASGQQRWSPFGDDTQRTVALTAAVQKQHDRQTLAAGFVFFR